MTEYGLMQGITKEEWDAGCKRTQGHAKAQETLKALPLAEQKKIRREELNKLMIVNEGN